MSSAFITHAKSRAPAIGLWLGLANPYTAELCAGAGFDWLLIDGEHAPNTLPTIVGQLQAIGTKAHVIVRPAAPDPACIKPLLDVGVTTLLVPMIETAAQARHVVEAAHYPPAGTRGVGTALARASNWGRDPDYLRTANDRISVIAQIETPLAVRNAYEIAKVDGVDALFVGLSDLSATMGLPGQPDHHDVQTAFIQARDGAREHGKPFGTLAATENLAALAAQAGCDFLAVGTDVGILTRGCGQLLRHYRGNEAGKQQPATSALARQFIAGDFQRRV